MKSTVIKILSAPFRINSAFVRLDLTTVHNQKGQAVVEYILVLVISVSIILGAFYQLNDAFRKFTANYFGNYVTCLLEAGELPGGAGGICEGSYQKFSLAEGRPLVGNGVGDGAYGSGIDGRNGAANRNGSRDSDGSGQSEKSAPGIKANSADGAGYSGGNRFGGTDNFGKTMDREKADAEGAKASDSSGATSIGRGGYRNYNTGATDTTTSAYDQAMGRLRYVPSGKEDPKRIEKKDAIAVNDADKKQKGQKIRISDNNRKIASGSEVDGSLTLPNFIRYILIAAILIIVLFFLGGQALALKKGQEKN